MRRVTGLGGIFFKSENPEAIKEWYRKHLGFETDQHGTAFAWKDHDTPEKTGYTVWSPFTMHTQYFSPSEKSFMVNYRVENLAALLNVLREEGVKVIGETEEYEYGKFGWIMDPEGNKIELWEPVDEKLGPTAITPPKK